MIITYRALSLSVFTTTLAISGCKSTGTLTGEASGVNGEVVLAESMTSKKVIINEDGSFNFPGEFTWGDSYEVVIERSNQECDLRGHKGIITPKPTTTLKLDCGNDRSTCPTLDEPVCGNKKVSIVCVTEPCDPITTYSTYSNECLAEEAGASIVFLGECGDIADSSVRDIQIAPFATTRFDQGDASSIRSIAIEGDLLSVEVNYTGGCEDHTFNLFGDTEFAESEPVQNSVYFFHQGNTDSCEKDITETVSFNLNNLKENYKTAYQVEHGEILLNITAPGAAPKASKETFPVLYTFDDRN